MMQELIIKYLKERPKVLFLVWILASLGSWVVGLPSWDAALSPNAVGSLLLNFVAITGAGTAASIIAKINPGK